MKKKETDIDLREVGQRDRKQGGWERGNEDLSLKDDVENDDEMMEKDKRITNLMTGSLQLMPF